MKNRKIINIDELIENTPLWPTHKHSPTFWEALGRSIATFGLLEETLTKAIFVISGSKEVPDSNEAKEELEAWNKLLESTVSDTLGRLTKKFEKEVKESKTFHLENISDFTRQLTKLGEWRNILCHGSWREPNLNGASTPFFVNNKQEIVEHPIDLPLLTQIIKETVEIIIHIMNVITSNGYEWPGTSKDKTLK